MGAETAGLVGGELALALAAGDCTETLSHGELPPYHHNGLLLLEMLHVQDHNGEVAGGDGAHGHS
jgi:hypothetical protein